MGGEVTVALYIDRARQGSDLGQQRRMTGGRFRKPF